ncbi:hypothetical protein [Methylobacterium sp. J-076]|uniref:hypothetical protein n=1 Tax=Methylobacterium sp. J-076 TaxID=2836655 RepID=UPI001FBB508C|nr:hypothetical protein [Methylobacterium sp. J-076]MCJ2014716.1 hypothetical protein [Methylobacterium sp. J-076]
MMTYRLGAVALLAAAAWCGLGASIDSHGSVRPPQAAAQGSLTPPAGQPRATAPGGLRRHQKAHRPHRRRR